MEIKVTKQEIKEVKTTTMRITLTMVEIIGEITKRITITKIIEDSNLRIQVQ